MATPGLLSGHLLINSSPLGWTFVLIVFCLFVIFIYFPLWQLVEAIWKAAENSGETFKQSCAENITGYLHFIA